jgi:hypothetical protein
VASLVDLFRQIIERGFNRGDLSVADEICSDALIEHEYLAPNARGADMHTRRFTRLTNAFSKKVENRAHSVALFAMYYNFVRIDKTLKVTPAMAAGVTSRLWEIDDIVGVLEAWEAAQVGQS